MRSPNPKTLHTPLLKTLTVALLLCAFSLAWGHVHTGPQAVKHEHDCLLCQWAGMPASMSASFTILVTFQVIGCFTLFSDPDFVQPLRHILRSRSPPSVSLF